MKHADARELANQIDAKLLATDKRFQRSVTIIHQEGSVFHVQHAFLMECQGWLMMFPEHHPPRVFDMEDLDFYRQYEFVEVQQYNAPKKK